jgi:hypothetical protein
VSLGRVLAAAGASFVVVIALAFAWDSVRALRAAREDVAEVDRELRLQEERLVSLVGGVPGLSERVRAEARAWSEADGRSARHAAYDTFVDDVRSDVLANLDAEDPNARRLADGVAGALNRRDIAFRSYDDGMTACRMVAATRRGRVAAWLLDLGDPCGS